MAKKSFHIFIVSAVLTIFVLFASRYDPEVMKIDKGYYQSYTQSIIEDGDYNIFNQVDPVFRWIATKTYNHVDFHDHGISVLWTPFFLYTKLLKSFGLNPDVFLSTNYNTAQIIAGLFFGLLALLLSFKLIRLFWGNSRGSLEVIIALVVGTPFLWHMLFHPANSDITVSVLPVISTLIFLSVIEKHRKRDWFLFGAWMGFSVIAKITMGFYYLLPGVGLLMALKEKGSKGFLSVLFFILGSSLLQGAFLVNETIKFGIPINGYLATVNSSYYLLFETFLGPIGYFYISPIYFLSLIGIYYYFKAGVSLSKENRALLGLVLILVPIVKMIVESFTFAVVGDLGARHYIIDISVFILTFSFFFQDFRNSKVKLILIRASFIFCALWMCIMCIWFSYHLPQKPFVWGQDYMRNLDFLFPTLEIMSFRANLFREVGLIQSLWETRLYYPLILIVSFLLVHLYHARINKRVLWGVSISAWSLYLIFTGLNLMNNEKNVIAQKEQGLYKDTVIGNGMKIYLYDENVGALVDTINFFKFRGNDEFSKGAQKVLENYLLEVRHQVVVDPIGFREGLDEGNFREPHN
ncbi:MAG: hypothetical protein CME70_08970 [Halobacteriovorax sp.]|nr:hypothetical protein [Halobacteriovorax sp.]|tara:strand:- start:48992 stop:50728 length:1737 start_codon:yes stop_codon:yes gene_type:complete